MLEILCSHLEKVASKAHKNMMTVGNLGVCFGPTLLRDEEETVAAIMDIKFANVVVEILIENWRQILLGETPLNLSKRLSVDSTTSQPKLTVLPLSPNQITPNKNSPQRLISPPQARPPPPYPHPPPPPGGPIYNNGPPKMVRKLDFEQPDKIYHINSDQKYVNGDMFINVERPDYAIYNNGPPTCIITFISSLIIATSTIYRTQVIHSNFCLDGKVTLETSIYVTSLKMVSK